jgi:hypothetical protein
MMSAEIVSARTLPIPGTDRIHEASVGRELLHAINGADAARGRASTASD